MWSPLSLGKYLANLVTSVISKFRPDYKKHDLKFPTDKIPLFFISNLLKILRRTLGSPLAIISILIFLRNVFSQVSDNFSSSTHYNSYKSSLTGMCYRPFNS